MNKSLLGQGTLSSVKPTDTKSFGIIQDFIEFSNKVFFPSGTDIKRASNKISISASLLNFTKDKISNSTYLTIPDYIWEELYFIFDNIRSSKYVMIKKKADEFFNFIKSYFNNISVEDKFITDQVKLDLAKIDIEYSDNTEPLVSSAIDNIKRSFSYMKRARFEKIIKNSNVTISFVSDESKKSNIKNGKDFGTGAYYDPRTKFIKILYNSLRKDADTITAIIHEYGHKFYYEFLPGAQRRAWEDFFELLSGKLNYSKKEKSIIEDFNYVTDKLRNELRAARNKATEENSAESVPQKFTDLFTLVKDSVPSSYLLFIRDEEGNPPKEEVKYLVKTIEDSLKKEGMRVYNDLGIINPPIVSRLASIAYERMKTITNNIKVDIANFPTEYATTNASEFFAETFTAYCVNNTPFGGKYRIPQTAFEKFIEISNIRGATHEKIIRRRNCI
jgi:hypothetical protein